MMQHLVLFFSIWRGNPESWDKRLKPLNNFMTIMCDSFTNVEKQDYTLEHARDAVRRALYLHHKQSFPFGPYYASLDILMETILDSRQFYATKNFECHFCQNVINQHIKSLWIDTPGYVEWDIFRSEWDKICTNKPTIADWFSYYMESESKKKCRACKRDRQKCTTTFHKLPSILSFRVATSHLLISKSFNIISQGDGS